MIRLYVDLCCYVWTCLQGELVKAQLLADQMSERYEAAHQQLAVTEANLQQASPIQRVTQILSQGLMARVCAPCAQS